MENFLKYRWFYTSSGILVVGGKNSGQNDKLLLEMVSQKEDRYVLHTSSPGSPFCIILEDIKKVSKKDIEETAVFTACFSQEWKKKNKKAKVSTFRLSQLVKERGMKEGSWKVLGKAKEIEVELKLTICKQKGVLRTVPLTLSKEKEIILEPGEISKEKIGEEILNNLTCDYTMEEILLALPAGGYKITFRKCKI